MKDSIAHSQMALNASRVYRYVQRYVLPVPDTSESHIVDLLVSPDGIVITAHIDDERQGIVELDAVDLWNICQPSSCVEFADGSRQYQVTSHLNLE